MGFGRSSRMKTERRTVVQNSEVASRSDVNVDFTRVKAILP
jgi:hypothetical protein